MCILFHVKVDVLKMLCPPLRYLKSTIGNIMLINRFRKRSEDNEPTPEENIFNFWIDYFVEGTKTELGDVIRFPVRNEQVLSLMLKDSLVVL